VANENHRKPRVGVPWRTLREEDQQNRAKLTHYLDAVTEAGGEAVPVSLKFSPEDLAALAKTLDGVVLPGSPADVDPARYGAARHPKASAADPDRERTDVALLDDAFAHKKPVLAICYGTQILNVLLGGSLYGDVASELHTSVRHSREGMHQDAADPVHAAWIEPGGEMGQLAASCGLEKRDGRFAALVNTSHHQAIRDLGRGLRAAAYSPDGVIEAVEHAPHKNWVIGVQWHPERLKGDALAEALFRSLVQAARAASARR
jgi:putative glutamine amidotransferase